MNEQTKEKFNEEKSSKTYFIVSVQCAQFVSKSGIIFTQDGDTVWLSDYKNHHTSTQGCSYATKFSVPPTRDEIQEWDCQPYYFRFKPGTEKIYQVDECFEKKSHEVTKEMLK